MDAFPADSCLLAVDDDDNNNTKKTEISFDGKEINCTLPYTMIEPQPTNRNQLADAFGAGTGTTLIVREMGVGSCRANLGLVEDTVPNTKADPKYANKRKNPGSVEGKVKRMLLTEDKKEEKSKESKGGKCNNQAQKSRARRIRMSVPGEPCTVGPRGFFLNESPQMVFGSVNPFNEPCPSNSYFARDPNRFRIPQGEALYPFLVEAIPALGALFPPDMQPGVVERHPEVDNETNRTAMADSTTDEEILNV